MVVTLKEIANFFEKKFPVELAESWDNPGLQVGTPDIPVKSILLCVDVTLAVLKEAIDLQVNLIVSHHPLIFTPIKKFNWGFRENQIIYALIKHDIAVYSAHTNLDKAVGGVADAFADVLGLKNTSPLYEESLSKVVFFCPEKDIENVLEAVFQYEGGRIGKYAKCSFSIKGKGKFLPLEGASPKVGSKGKLESIEESRVEIVIPRAYSSHVLQAIFATHPYEMPAVDIYEIESKGSNIGLGRIGELPSPMQIENFLNYLRSKLKIKIIKLTNFKENLVVKKVAILPGSGATGIRKAKSAGADIFVTGDIKYHDAQLANILDLTVVDAGHFSTEKVVLPVIKKIIENQFSNLEVFVSTQEKEPFLHFGGEFI